MRYENHNIFAVYLDKTKNKIKTNDHSVKVEGQKLILG